MWVSHTPTKSGQQVFQVNKILSPPVSNSIYRILSKYLSPFVSRKLCHLVAIKIGINKMVEGDEYLGYCNKILKQTTNIQGVFLCEMADFELPIQIAV